MDPRSLFFATVLTIGFSLVAPVPVLGSRSRRSLHPYPQAAADMRINTMQYKDLLEQNRNSLRHTRSTNDYVNKHTASSRNSVTSRHKRDLSELLDAYIEDPDLTEKQKLALLMDYFNYLRSPNIPTDEDDYDMRMRKRQPPVGFHAVRGKRHVSDTQ